MFFKMWFPKFRDLFSIVFENLQNFSGQVFFSFFGHFMVRLVIFWSFLGLFFSAPLFCVFQRASRARASRASRAQLLRSKMFIFS